MVNTENVPLKSTTLKPPYYRPLKIPSAMWVLMQSTTLRFFQSSENNLSFPVTSSCGFITVCMNNYCLWFYTNANQSTQREQESSILWLCYLIQVLTRPGSGVCLHKVWQPPVKQLWGALVRSILYCLNWMFNDWREVNAPTPPTDWRKENPIHSVVSSGALPI